MSKRTIHLLLLTVVTIICLGVVLVLLLTAGIFRSPLQGEKSFDFGIVQIQRPYTVLEHTFRLTNETDHTLKLADAVPTCGCTTTDWPEEPVGVGEELVVPVHLKLQRSQHRSSKVRLTFESGEVVVLFIEGTGRFKQPLRCFPPTIKVLDGNKEGTRNMLLLEWYQLSTPKLPTFGTPKNIRVEPLNWVISRRGDKKLGTPDEWSVQLYTFLDGELAEGDSLIIKMEQTPPPNPLLVPLEQVEQLDRPQPISDPNRR
jgi:hypothetical protein